MGFCPLRLEARKPLGEIGKILAVHLIDVEFLAIGWILRNLSLFITGQQRLHRPHHVERLEPLVLHPCQPLLLGNRRGLSFADLTDGRRGGRGLFLDRVGLAECSRIKVGSVCRPGGEHPEKIDHRGSQQPDQRTNGPRLLRFDDTITDDLVG